MKTADQVVHMIGATAGSRFRAAQRLEARDRRNNRFLLGASASLIILSVIQLTLPTSSITTVLGVLVTCLSVAMLSLSGVQYGSTDLVKAELMHRCALEINEVRRHLESRATPVAQSDIDQALNAYNTVLLRYALNHENVDYLGYKLDKWWLFEELNDQLLTTGTPAVQVSARQAWRNRQALRFRLLAPKIMMWLAVVFGTALLLAATRWLATSVVPVGTRQEVPILP